jgi:hypothetical protein
LAGWLRRRRRGAADDPHGDIGALVIGQRDG